MRGVLPGWGPRPRAAPAEVPRPESGWGPRVSTMTQGVCLLGLLEQMTTNSVAKNATNFLLTVLEVRILTGLGSRSWHGEFLLEALREDLFPCLFHLPEVACVP